MLGVHCGGHNNLVFAIPTGLTHTHTHTHTHNDVSNTTKLYYVYYCTVFYNQDMLIVQ